MALFRLVYASFYGERYDSRRQWWWSVAFDDREFEFQRRIVRRLNVRFKRQFHHRQSTTYDSVMTIP
jgi:hypothetical protein